MAGTATERQGCKHRKEKRVDLDFMRSDEQRALRQQVRQLAEEKLAPMAPEFAIALSTSLCRFMAALAW